MTKAKDSVWDTWEKNLTKYDTPFDIERNQPQQQIRDGLDKIFVCKSCDCRKFKPFKK